MLYIVAGPIGNFKDITLRALETLKEADLVACEDTRRTGMLLKHFGIKTRVMSYYDSRETDKLPRLLELLKKGGKVALFSDAGTPAISDPGYRLVKTCLEEGIAISPIPGPSALAAAISISGQPSDKVLFLGFPPKQKEKKRRLLNDVKDCQKVVSAAILFESPFRLAALLEDIVAVLGPQTNVTVCSELTKVFEKIQKGTAQELIQNYRSKKLKGEFTVVISLKNRNTS